MSEMASVRIRIPASTSNLGPGFDTLGLALSMYNYVTLCREGTETELELVGSNTQPFIDQARRMATEALRHAWRAPPPPLHIRFESHVPIARGLGSSATLRLGIVAGMQLLLRGQLDRKAALRHAVELEGHPDNCAAAMHGGFIAAATVNGAVRFSRCEVSRALKCIAVIPDLPMPTRSARNVLPKEVPMRDAVFNMQRTALLVAAFFREDYEAMRGLLDDRLHQPYRETLIPPLRETIDAACQAGAIGAFLSGAGSCIIALALQRVEPIGAAMRDVMVRRNIAAELHVLTADNQGLTVIRRTEHGVHN